MNIFEEFVEELKQENLLENTVTESKTVDGDEVSEEDVKSEKVETAETLSSEDKSSQVDSGNDTVEEEDGESEVSLDEENLDLVETGLDASDPQEKSTESEDTTFELDLDDTDDEDSKGNEASDVANLEVSNDDVDSSEELDLRSGSDSFASPTKRVKLVTEADKEAYRQRLVDSVSSLQMVDHILSGVQREQMRTRPEPFDSLPVKQALHKFFEAFYELDVQETSAEESELLKEIELWDSALLVVDKKISVADLRRYCESTKPPLSSQASLALVRFYRNAPFSELVRGKFDLVATRLFTKEIKDGKRQMIFERDELIEHLKELYADWSSIPLYSENDEDSEIVLAAFKFEDFISEAAKVEKFDDLIKKGFFKRIKLFKKKTQENFFAPLLVASAVESNVVIGNRYVDLIEDERQRVNSKNNEGKLVDSDDLSALEAKSKSGQIAELLNEGKDDSAEIETVEGAKSLLQGKTAYVVLGVLAAVLVSFLIWNFVLGGTDTSLQQGKTISMADTPFSKFFISSRISNDTLEAVMNESWSALALSEREKTLKRILETGKRKGFSNIRLSNSSGDAIGFASKSGINVIE